MTEILKSEYDKQKDKIILLGDLNVDALEYRHTKLSIFFKSNFLIKLVYWERKRINKKWI